MLAKEIDTMLKNQLGRSVKVIKRNAKKFSTSGKTANSIQYSVKDGKGKIFGSGGLLWLERGRGPAKKSTPKWPLKSLIGWMQIKGIGSDLDPKGLRRLASFLKYYINKFGTKKYRKGQGKIVDDVYTSELEDLDERIKADLDNLIRQDLSLKQFNLKGNNHVIVS